MNKSISKYAAATAMLLAFAIPAAGAFAAQGDFSGHGRGMGKMGGMMPFLTADQIVTAHQTMFAQQASLLGIGVDEVKSAWAAGRTITQLAKEKGITPAQLKEKMKAAQLAKMKEQLKTLVDRGIITQSQADARLQFMQNQKENRVKKNHFGRGKAD